jgi:cytochrome c-type biogenesis protein CcmF
MKRSDGEGTGHGIRLKTRLLYGSFVRTNLILGMLCFVLVMYSTFLTRSGVLGDTSVHSFVDPGMWAYWLLIGMMALALLVPGIILARRWKEIPRRAAKHNYFSREFALFLGASAIVFVPIITDLLYGKKSAVDIAYYATTTLPLGIVIGLLAGVGQLLWWTRSDRQTVLRSLRLPFALSVLTLALLVFSGVHQPILLLFLFGAAFALWANLQVGWTIVRRNPKYAGGSIAHIGIALMFFGFIASTEFDAMQTLSLPQGQPVQALGYTLKYTGYRVVEGDRYAFDVEVEKDGKRFRMAPVMYESKYNEGIMRHPDIVNLLSKDFYLAPLSLDQPVTPASTQARAVEVLVVEASIKPYINLVWAGVIILLVGFLVTIVRRAAEAGQTGTEEQENVRQASPGAG